MWHRNLVLKNCWLPVMREMILHADAVKQVRPGGIVKRRKYWEMFAIREPCLQAYKVLFRKDRKASVWKIILPDCLAGICHYTRCDWLRYLSGQVKPACEVV